MRPNLHSVSVAARSKAAGDLPTKEVKYALSGRRCRRECAGRRFCRPAVDKCEVLGFGWPLSQDVVQRRRCKHILTHPILSKHFPGIIKSFTQGRRVAASSLRASHKRRTGRSKESAFLGVVVK